jgi:glutamyl endopeptidase
MKIRTAAVIAAAGTLSGVWINAASAQEGVTFSDGERTVNSSSYAETLPACLSYNAGYNYNDSASSKEKLQEQLKAAGVNTALPDMAALKNLKPMGKGQEIPIGQDTRIQGYTYDFPARAFVYLALDTNNDGVDDSFCSGTLVGPDKVLTAGHCVHPGDGSLNWYSVTVYPGLDSYSWSIDDGGYWGSCGTSNMSTYTKWANDGNEQYDIAAIKLDCTVGYTTGWLGVVKNQPVGTPARIHGYPGDKYQGTQWGSADKIKARSASPYRQIFYSIDTAGGQSGSGVWADYTTGACTGPNVYGVHAYRTHGSGNHALYNHGTNINSGVYSTVYNWINNW